MTYIGQLLSGHMDEAQEFPSWNVVDLYLYIFRMYTRPRYRLVEWFELSRTPLTKEINPRTSVYKHFTQGMERLGRALLVWITVVRCHK